jgi:hypothetical protein
MEIEVIFMPAAKSKRTGKVKKSVKGDKLVCGTCGLVVTVDNLCGCMDACDVICCGSEMQTK